MGKTLTLFLLISIIIGIFIDRQKFKVNSYLWLPFLIVLILFFPIFLTLLVEDIIKIKFLTFNIIGTPDGWLGFLGAVVGLTGIWWQVTKEERISKEKEKNEIKIYLEYFLEKNMNLNIIYELQRELTLSIIYNYKNIYYRLPEDFIVNNISKILSFPHGKDILEINEKIKILHEERDLYLNLTKKAYKTYSFDRVPISKKLNTANEYLKNELNILSSLSDVIIYFLMDQELFEKKIENLYQFIQLKEMNLTLGGMAESYLNMIKSMEELNANFKDNEFLDSDDSLDNDESEIQNDIESLELYEEIIKLDTKMNNLYIKIKKNRSNEDIKRLYKAIIDFYENEEKELKKWSEFKERIELEKNKLKKSTVMIMKFSDLFKFYGLKLLDYSSSSEEEKIKEAELSLNLEILIKKINTNGFSVHENSKEYYEKMKKLKKNS